MERKKDAKSFIESEIAKGNPDWRLIERLSRNEVDTDSSQVRFTVDAGHIQRLGFELVAKQETALAELIKNSFDADATTVSVHFGRHEKPGGTLVIEDNGTGMTADIVRDAWMKISTINKREFPVSPRYGRIRAGRKGIGRFAVQRLGKRLVLETEVAGEKHGIRVYFNWDDEFQAGKSLHDVFSRVEEYEKGEDQERTRLSIFDLREAWTDSAIQRVWKSVLLLQPPFKVSNKESNQHKSIREVDPGFEVVINSISGQQQRKLVSIENKFLNHAIAEIAGHIDADGNAHCTVRSEKLNIDAQQDFADKFYLTGAISFTAKYFIYDSRIMSPIAKSEASEMGRHYGGIRIYRNGFRVSPYGDSVDDWLRLDGDVGRRSLLIPANNRHFFGQVELDSEQNILFEETSSREGLVENDAFEELRSFVRASLEWAAKRVAAARGRKQVASQKDFVSTVASSPRKPSQIIQSLFSSSGNLELEKTDDFNKDTSNKIEDRSQAAKLTADVVASVQAEVERWEKEVEERQAESLKYEEMLRILASLGLSISIFGHEIKGVRSSIAAHLYQLKEEVSSLEECEGKREIVNLIAGLQDATGKVFDLGGYIANAVSSTESRELKQLSMKGVIERFVDQFSQYMERQHIKFDSSIIQEHLRTISMHSSEFDSVLLNFLTNSIKSMKVAKVSPRKVRIFAREEDGFILLGFEDNGGGVAPEIQDRIFDAFFTTTIDIDDDGVSGLGTGLGLKIVHDIATSYGGSVRLGEPSEGYECCFEFRVPSATANGV